MSRQEVWRKVAGSGVCDANNSYCRPLSDCPPPLPPLTGHHTTTHCCSPVLLQYHNITILQYYNITISQYETITIMIVLMIHHSLTSVTRQAWCLSQCQCSQTWCWALGWLVGTFHYSQPSLARHPDVSSFCLSSLVLLEGWLARLSFIWSQRLQGSPGGPVGPVDCRL